MPIPAGGSNPDPIPTPTVSQQTVFDVGDLITSRLRLGVAPDGTTVVAVAVYRPDGSAITAPGISGWANVDEKTTQWYATDDGLVGSATTVGVSDGDWLVVWSVTGTGASISPKVFNVAPLPGTSSRPPWSPFLSQVADHVPWLTVDNVTPGSGTYLGTFTGNTVVTDEVAQRHIDGGASPIIAVGTVPVAYQRLASTIVALRAAASLARAYPRTQRDYDSYRDLDKLADTYMKQLTAVVVESGGSPLVALFPEWSFPDPVAYPGDYNI